MSAPPSDVDPLSASPFSPCGQGSLLLASWYGRLAPVPRRQIRFPPLAGERAEVGASNFARAWKIFQYGSVSGSRTTRPVVDCFTNICGVYHRCSTGTVWLQIHSLAVNIGRINSLRDNLNLTIDTCLNFSDVLAWRNGGFTTPATSNRRCRSITRLVRFSHRGTATRSGQNHFRHLSADGVVVWHWLRRRLRHGGPLSSICQPCSMPGAVSRCEAPTQNHRSPA